MKHHHTYRFWKNLFFLLGLTLFSFRLSAQEQLLVPVLEFVEEEVYVDSEGGNCTLEVYFYEELNLFEVLNFLNEQMQSIALDWIFAIDFVVSDFDPTYGAYVAYLTFSVAENKTGYERTLLLNSSLGDCCVLSQLSSSLLPPITTYTLSSDCFNNAFPGRKTVVTLSGSEVGVRYIFAGDTIAGTGTALSFERVLEEGVYMMIAIKDSFSVPMNGRVSISYYPFLRAGLCTKEVNIDVMLRPLSTYSYRIILNVPLFDEMTTEQLWQVDDMIAQINNGQSTCYSGFRLKRSGNSQIMLMAGPNLNNEAWLSEVFFALRDGEFYQDYRIHVSLPPFAGEVVPCTLSLFSFTDLSNYTLALDRFQLAVCYKLFKDGVYVTEQYADNLSVRFEGLSGGGTYHVEAHYVGTVTRMMGEVFIDGGAGEQNYVQELTYHREDRPVSTYTYYDGLGREVQTRHTQYGPDGQDLIRFRVYDTQGRESKSYLPYSLPTTAYRTDPVAEQRAYYRRHFSDSLYTYGEHVFSNTPEDRIIETSSPGAAYRLGGGHTTTHNLRKNRSSDAVKHYTLQGSSLTLSGTYAANRLMVSETTDGEGQRVLEYRDASGRTICKSVEGVSTYYIYDALERLRYIVPPLQDSLFVSGTKALSELSAYCYYFEYDAHGRVYKQYLPGAGYTLTLYDHRDRPVFRQDAAQRLVDRWHFIKYDDFGRVVIEGLCSGSEAELQALLEAQTVFGETRGEALHGYTNVCPPQQISDTNCLTITYYDDYSWPDQNVVSFSLSDTLGVVVHDRVQGQVTGRKNKVLGISTHQWLLTGLYYDRYYQTIQSVAQLYPSGLEVTANEHDFGGHIVRVKVRQSFSDQEQGYTKWMTYDDHGRLRSIRQELLGDVTNGKVTLAEYAYDDFGRLSREKLHNGSDSISYVYDLQGREVGRTSTAFSYRLGFENGDPSLSGLFTPRYNGHLSHVQWGTENVFDRGYAYSYDSFGQLTNASYLEVNGLSWSKTEKYAEKGLRYDRNGNLLSLKRSDGTGASLHDIHYQYAVSGNGNAVSRVNVNGTASADYQYDANGNLTFDGRRGLNITYNALNLPASFHTGTEKISYLYSSDGRKLAQGLGSSLIYYRDVFVYAGDELLYVQHPLGLIRKTDRGYIYNYFLQDHLGSTRVLLEGSGAGLTAVQATDYYPYGLAFHLNNLEQNKYLYSGKEYQDASIGGEGLGLYDFGSRFYDPYLARWFCQDPALQMISPYGYCGNNPVMFVDPDGEFVLTAFLIGAAIGGIINVATHWKEIHNFWDGLAAFGIGAGAGALGGLTGGAAFAGLGGVVAGGGGFLAGMVGGAVSSATSMPIQGIGNHLYFNDPMFSAGDYLMNIGFGAVLGGSINGGIAAIKGNNFWNGMVNPSKLPTPQLNATPLKIDFPENELLSPTSVKASEVASLDLPPVRKLDVPKIQEIPPVLEGKNFLKYNFRNNLKLLTGETPGRTIHAHHVFPNEHVDKFMGFGINIHDPRYGVWWPASGHLKNARYYNDIWKEFLTKPRSHTEILTKGREMMQKHGISVNY